AQHPYDLSPALRKLAALAGALALEPTVLVLDEPTAGLDRAGRGRVADAVREHADRGAALLVVTHDLAFAAETLERGIVLDRGRLACDEPLERLLTSAERLKPLGLVPPPIAALSVALDLPGRPVRERAAAHTLARVAGGRSASSIARSLYGDSRHDCATPRALRRAVSRHGGEASPEVGIPGAA